jgi:hypothetical protein
MARRSATSWVAVLVLVGACGSSSSKSVTATTAPASTIGATSTPAASTTSSTPASTSTAAPATTAHPAPSTTTTTAVAPSAVQVSETQNGSTVHVAKGGSVAVVLHSTYWTLAAPSNAAVLQEEGQPTVTPMMQGCVPGQGCGTVTAVYAVVGPGQSQLSASRTSCGEALRCTGTQGAWSVTVDVPT